MWSTQPRRPLVCASMRVSLVSGARLDDSFVMAVNRPEQNNSSRNSADMHRPHCLRCRRRHPLAQCISRPSPDRVGWSVTGLIVRQVSPSARQTGKPGTLPHSIPFMSPMIQQPTSTHSDCQRAHLSDSCSLQPFLVTLVKALEGPLTPGQPVT